MMMMMQHLLSAVEKLDRKKILFNSLPQISPGGDDGGGDLEWEKIRHLVSDVEFKLLVHGRIGFEQSTSERHLFLNQLISSSFHPGAVTDDIR